MNRETTEIIKHLERITATGRWQSDIFDDFLDMTLATLEAMPAHLQAARKTGQLAEDTEETKKLWERLRGLYKPVYFSHFSQAFHALLGSTWQYADVIGEVYMEWGIPNKNTGQFFTPWPVAAMNAKVTCNMDEVYNRLAEAYGASPYGAMQMALYGGDQAQARARLLDFVRRMGEDIIPLCADGIRPITISDPACGSGVMLLAAAECYEPWVHKWGLVQFYGQDIDPACVKMARVNMMLYGLNGYQIKLALALAEDELAARPPADQALGPWARVDQVTEQVRGFSQLQLI